MKYNTVLVIGSINMDLVIKTERYPIKGETVIGGDFFQLPGGKGANQACTVSRLGGDVGFVGACGNDIFGQEVSDNLIRLGVDISDLYRVDERTGIAVITIEKDGDNRIIVAQGANKKITVNMIDRLEEKIKKAEVILLQLEIPLKAVLHTIGLAKKHDTIVILDPAPAQKLPNEVYSKIDFLLPNESELEILLKEYKLNSLEEKAFKLLELGVKNIIVTRGEKGVSFYSKKKQKMYPACHVKAIDTTAAGDAFAGALAYGLGKTWDEDKIISFAITVAGISVTKIGAQSSLPSLTEVDNFLNKEPEAI